MTLIQTISVLLLVVGVVTFICGCVSGDDGVFITGIVIMLIWLISTICFQFGAMWQRDDTMTNFNLVPKEAWVDS